MSRVPRIISTVCFAIVFFVGRYALGHEGSRTTNVGSDCSIGANNNFAGLPPSIPVAGADIEELTGKARVCLSMLNTFLRRYKKRPITTAMTPSGVPNSAHTRSLNEEIELEARS
jgi:hypothetical protein